MAIVTFVGNGVTDDLNVLRNGQITAGLQFDGDRWIFVGRGVPRITSGAIQSHIGSVVEFDQRAELHKAYRPFRAGFAALESAILAALRAEKDAGADIEQLAKDMAKTLRTGAKRNHRQVWP